MGLVDRVWRLVRANVNDWIEKNEDPEKILEQAVADMQDDLVRMRQAVAQAIATQKRTERQVTHAELQSNEWYRRAQLALQKGDEALAREALTRRKSYQETAEAMAGQLQQQGSVVVQLKQNLQQLESKLIDAKTKKDMYIARARAAKTSQQLNDMLGGIGTSNAIQAFERMEEKVLQLEAQAEVSAELSTDQLEKKFQALGEASEIDQELVALKTQLLGTTPTGQIGGSGGSSSATVGNSSAASSSSDPELEKLRREIRGI
ncbi:PspA/IM30 family protein [Alkalinema sp. FACHB-956]|uniref:PspA/IM30 family protein n=1 Tax=Alkalinema sp. FACHB-956 TaxID=2692768 RepID=UPI001684D682|nr:PspA/IM30 family protein [Alkalinema sp. FACHB-956]